jgi:large subunit ribosomal protein L19e
MNLENKKQLAARTLHVGKNKIIFSQEALSEIKEAITKQDIKTLYQEGIIRIKPKRGRKTIVRRKIRRGPGKIKVKVNKRKQIYVKITRKLRANVKDLKDKGEINRDMYIYLRKKIKMRFFKSKAHLKEYLQNPPQIKISEKKVKREELKQKESPEKKEKKSSLKKTSEKEKKSAKKENKEQ